MPLYFRCSSIFNQINVRECESFHLTEENFPFSHALHNVIVSERETPYKYSILDLSSQDLFNKKF